MRLNLTIYFWDGTVHQFENVRNLHYFNDDFEVRLVVSDQDDFVCSFVLDLIKSMVLTPEEIDE